MAAVDTSATGWLPYDMDLLAALEGTTEQAVAQANNGEAMDWQGVGGGSVLSEEAVNPEARDVMALYEVLSLPILTPAPADMGFIGQPYEEREAPGKAPYTKRGRKSNAAVVASAKAALSNATVSPIDDIVAPESRGNKGKISKATSPEELLHDTQLKLHEATQRNAMLQRQVSKTLELIRTLTEERDAFKDQLAKSEAAVEAANAAAKTALESLAQSQAATKDNHANHKSSHHRSGKETPSTSGTARSSPQPISHSAVSTPPTFAATTSVRSPGGSSTISTPPLVTKAEPDESEVLIQPANGMNTEGCPFSGARGTKGNDFPCVGGLKFAPNAWERQHQAFDKIAEVVARGDATDDDYYNAIKGYCAASLQQNFILRDEIDIVCSPQFMMRNLFINTNGGPWMEPHGERLEKNLAKWAAIMKGIDASQQQFERFVEASVKIRASMRALMDERRAIMDELMEFFATKLAYFQRLFLGEEETNSIGLMKAATLLSRLRSNLLRYSDTWGNFVYCELRDIFSARQMAQVYLLARRNMTFTTDALEAVNSLARSTDGTAMVFDGIHV